MDSGIIIRRLPVNTKGRDFFVGDLHGCYALLMRELEAVEFDRATDRLISVGDLVDRGSENLECLGLLEEPWFHAVRGNHEELLLYSVLYLHGEQAARSGFHTHMANGGEWVRGVASSAELMGLMQLVADLPHVLVVGEGESRINVVHAEFPDGTTDADIDAGLPGVTDAELIWSRRIMSASIPLPERQEGLSLTVCGHTPAETPRLRLSHLCIDTGAVFTGDLTVTEVKH